MTSLASIPVFLVSKTRIWHIPGGLICHLRPWTSVAFLPFRPRGSIVVDCFFTSISENPRYMKRFVVCGMGICNVKIIVWAQKFASWSWISFYFSCAISLHRPHFTFTWFSLQHSRFPSNARRKTIQNGGKFQSVADQEDFQHFVRFFANLAVMMTPHVSFPEVNTRSWGSPCLSWDLAVSKSSKHRYEHVKTASKFEWGWWLDKQFTALLTISSLVTRKHEHDKSYVGDQCVWTASIS